MKIAAQMYSVRQSIAEKGYGYALKELARMGFTAVEHAGGFVEFDNKIGDLRKFMDDLGISMIGTHVGGDVYDDPEKLKAAVDTYATLGAKYIIDPWDGRAMSPDTVHAFADKLNEVAEILKPYGMYCGYHNHTKEFKAWDENGKSLWEILAENTSADVVLELDCGWAAVAGYCPSCMVRKYPGRGKVLHFKPAVLDQHRDLGKIPVIGKDSVAWKDVICAAKEVAGTEAIIVEQEEYLPDTTDIASIEESCKGLLKLV